MLGFRFKHVFVALMALAALSAFVIPPRFTDRAVPQLQILFAPVARPTQALVSRAAGHGGPELPPDERPAYAIRLENDRLVQENIWLRQHLDELQRVNNEREKLGDLRPLCTPVKVLGPDPGPRESLAVAGSSLEGLKDGMYVVYPGGIVGTLQRSGVAGGQVQLITNPGFRVTAYFSGTRKVTQDGKTETAILRVGPERVLVEGVGRQEMRVRQVKAADLKAWDLRPNDYVILDDPDWPNRLRGTRIGRVTAIVPHKDRALFAEVHIAPTSDLLKLREVMVLTKNQ